MGEEKKKATKSESDHQDITFLSHQLKSPIEAIQMLLKTISEGYTGEANPKTLHVVERAVNRAAEAKNIISDLLNYLYSENQTTARDEFDLVKLFNNLVIKYASVASEKGISLQFDLPLKKKITVFGDNTGLHHAIRNIIENAIQYSPANGSITARLSYCEETKTCEMQIADTGFGIAKDELEHIFDPFYRSLKHKMNIPGTGLGLPIAQRVVTSHNGSINVDSEEGKGTTFSIVLPFTRISDSEYVPERKKVIIIGGATAGPKTAARLRRLDEELDITIIEKSQFLSYSGCGLPYYISGKVRSAKALMSTADNTIRDVNFFESIKNIKALNKTVALGIDRKKKAVKTQNLETHAISYLPYDVLVLAAGAAPYVPNIPGIQMEGVYSLHSIEDADAIKKELSQKNARDIFIIGGGLIGVSTAESLIDAGARVAILERESHILLNYMDGDIALKIQNIMNKKGIKITTNCEIIEIKKSKDRFTIVTERDSYAADFIILSVGVKPNTTLAQNAGLTIGDSGGIKVNEYLQTSDENIYAIGDCVESLNVVTKKHEYWPLGSIATKMGRIAADNICGRASDFRGSNGTAMFKIFDTNVARTGLTLKTARASGFKVETVVISGLDRVNYGKNAQNVCLKIIADKRSRVILGAQGYGRGDVPSKIEILSCAIMQSLTLDDVFKFDLGYSPAFNSPIDIAQTACLVLDNKIDDLLRTITLEEFEKEKDNATIIDVSPLSEYTVNSIPGSINIPLENIRLEETSFNKKSKVILYSKTSSGAYEAYKYLASRGYSNLYVLEGGYLSWND